MAMQSDWLYAAGIIDGEGCVGISRRNGEQSSPYVCVSNTDERLMVWLQSTFGGNVRRNGPDHRNRKACYQWRLLARQATDFLAAIRPLLKLKGDQADVVLAFRQLMGVRRVSPENRAQRDRLVARIHVLNKKGVA